MKSDVAIKVANFLAKINDRILAPGDRILPGDRIPLGDRIPRRSRAPSASPRRRGRFGFGIVTFLSPRSFIMGLGLAVLRTRMSLRVKRKVTLKVANFFAEFYILRLPPWRWPLFFVSAYVSLDVSTRVSVIRVQLWRSS